MNVKIKMLVFSLLLISANGHADEEFDQLWKTIAERSFHLKSSEEQVLASEKNKTRMGHHWLPTLYATGTSYMSNDPGANMLTQVP